jgi:uncharacterized protein
MPMSLTELLVPTYRNLLKTLAGLLDKAAAQAQDEAEVLLSARLAQDMFPLASQLRFAAFQAQEAVFRLTDRPVPEAILAVAAEGRAGGEAPGSALAARARLAEALNLLEGLAPGALDGGADLPIVLALPGGLTFEMTGAEYARDWALPQFYFHVVTAYAILRSQGVPIGKADYVPHMFAYMRPTRDAATETS